MSDRHQGKFHLLAIFAIPVLLVLIVVVKNWLLVTAYVVVLAFTGWLLFRKR